MWKNVASLTAPHFSIKLSHEQPNAFGKYTFEKAGELHGDFAGHYVLGQITGIFVIMTGNAEITITQKTVLDA
jgi:hypothetical protein